MIVNEAITINELYQKLLKIWGDEMTKNKIRNNMHGALKTLQDRHDITKIGRGMYIRNG